MSNSRTFRLARRDLSVIRRFGTAAQAFWVRKRRRHRNAVAVPYEDFLLANYSGNLKAFFPLAFDIKDVGALANHGFSYSGVAFSGPTPSGFKYPICAGFNGSSSQVRLENTTYPFGLPRWTVMCWFRKTGAGATTSTAGASDGFPSTDPIVPLVTKGRGEADGSNVDCNWFLGLNKVSNGSTYRLAGDYEDSVNPPNPNNHRIVGTTNIQDSQWYHAAFTYDGAQLKLYLNGALEATVATSSAPRNDSIQKAGIGTAYTSASAAAGFFQGLICGVSIWSETLNAAQILELYGKGTQAYRKTITFTQNAADSAINHGTNFANWTLDGLGSAKDGTGVTVIANSGNFAKVSINGLAPNTDYWAKGVIAAKSGGAVGPLRVAALGTQGASIAGAGGAAVNIGSAAGTFYLKLTTDASASPNVLVIEHTGSANGETFKFSDFAVFPIPSRSGAKLAVLGDRTGGFIQGSGDSVSDALLAAAADTMNVIAIGDTGDSTNTYGTCNDRLKLGPAGNNGILSRGGKVYPCMGNHDYDGSRETELPAYWGTSGYNAGKTYYSVVLGNTELFFFDDNSSAEDSGIAADNGGGYSAATVAALQDSNEGQWFLKTLAQSQAAWKIAIFHHGAYTSSSPAGASDGYAALRWDWLGLGVPFFLQGHFHGIERVYRDGITFYTVAMGGGNHHGWDASDVSGSQWKETNQSRYGFLKIHDSPAELVLEFFDTSQTLLDRSKIVRAES